MRGPFRIVAYAIVSLDGMIADASGVHPDVLMLEPDQRFYHKSLDRADVVVHGRRSQEVQPNSWKRRRLIVTHRVESLAQDADNANARLWNPAGTSLEEACAALGCRAGEIAVLGGPQVYGYFLKVGYDDFYLSRAEKVRLPGGLPLFPKGRLGCAPEENLAAAGLKPGPLQRLGDDVTLVEWTP